jgi:hypothetical protein
MALVSFKISRPMGFWQERIAYAFDQFNYYSGGGWSDSLGD